jgi:hypothetical protein
VALMATAAVAVPITLPTGEVTKLKFTNFENILDSNKNGILGDVGDDIEGILFVTSVGTITNPNLYNAQLASRELTGYFHISIVGGVVGGNHVDFDLSDSADKIELYVGTGATKNWTAGSGVATDISNASDGALWAAVYADPNGWYEAVGDLVGSDFVNTNFANLGVNNTGYTFLPQLFYPLTGDPTAHTYLGNFHADHKVDAMFKSRLFSVGVAPGWYFRSEDPMYLWVVPEPGTITLLGVGIAGLGLLRLRRRRT